MILYVRPGYSIIIGELLLVKSLPPPVILLLEECSTPLWYLVALLAIMKFTRDNTAVGRQYPCKITGWGWGNSTTEKVGSTGVGLRNGMVL